MGALVGYTQHQLLVPFAGPLMFKILLGMYMVFRSYVHLLLCTGIKKVECQINYDESGMCQEIDRNDVESSVGAGLIPVQIPSQMKRVSDLISTSTVQYTFNMYSHAEKYPY